MTDGDGARSQATLSDSFGGTPTEAAEERPTGEAAHVAGNGGQRAEVVDLSEEQFPPVDERVELAVTQVDYTVEGYGDEEYPVLHVFGRTEDREAVHVRVHGFRPYFYTPLETLEHETPEDGPVREGHVRDGRIVEEARLTGLETYGDLRAEGEPVDPDRADDELVLHESIRGRDLVKVFGRTPRDVGQLREEFVHYEADILFPNRLLIDKDVTSGVSVPARETDENTYRIHHTEIETVEATAPLRVNTFDIEVDDRRGFPEDGEEPIVCLTSHDSYRDEYVVWLYTAPEGIEGPDDLVDYEPIGDSVDVDVRNFESEAAMLDAFVEYIEETDPDVTTGWNFADFDAPYLLDRIEVLAEEAPDADEYDLDIDRLSRVNEVWRSDWQGPNVKGRVVFDLLYAYKRTQFTELDSYRLDAVGETELGVGKERYPGDIGDLWERDPKRLAEYNLRDVELCVEIDRRQEVIPFWEEVASFVGCKLEDATTPGDAVDLYILHKVHGEFALPSKGTVDSEEYAGGAVFDPITGIKENVTVLDLASLYPMCMVTINASPETKVDPDAYDGGTYRAPNGTHFRKEPDGIIREMVDELLSEREQKKSLRNEHEPGTAAYEQYDRQQGAVKVIMNSLYGVLGWDRFRLYDKEMGAAVTATGRRVIEFTEEISNSLDYQVAYGDTDSIMLELGPDVSKEAAIEQSFELEAEINARYDDLAEEFGASEHRFRIEFEKLYRRFFQAGKKKRYAGHIVWKEGKDVDDIDITGFEYKRSDIAPITKEVQKHVIEQIVTGASPDDVKDYVRGVIEDFGAGNVSLEQIGIPGGIGQRLENYDTATAQIRGAKYANLLLGTNFGRGSKPKRIYLERVLPEYFIRVETERPKIKNDPIYRDFNRNPDVIAFEFDDQIPDEFIIDYDRMLNKTLRGPIERVIEAIGISWEEAKGEKSQMGLDQFM